MNDRSLRLQLIKYGMQENNTFLASLDTSKEEITALREEDEYIFEHITDAKKSTITDIEGTYAKMFLLHGLNLAVFDEDFIVQIYYKLDGTIMSYGG